MKQKENTRSQENKMAKARLKFEYKMAWHNVNSLHLRTIYQPGPIRSDGCFRIPSIWGVQLFHRVKNYRNYSSNIR